MKTLAKNALALAIIITVAFAIWKVGCTVHAHMENGAANIFDFTIVAIAGLLALWVIGILFISAIAFLLCAMPIWIPLLVLAIMGHFLTWWIPATLIVVCVIWAIVEIRKMPEWRRKQIQDDLSLKVCKHIRTWS